MSQNWHTFTKSGSSCLRIVLTALLSYQCTVCCWRSIQASRDQVAFVTVPGIGHTVDVTYLNFKQNNLHDEHFRIILSYKPAKFTDLIVSLPSENFGGSEDVQKLSFCIRTHSKIRVPVTVEHYFDPLRFSSYEISKLSQLVPLSHLNSD